jgi:hypothetical protein
LAVEYNDYVNDTLVFDQIQYYVIQSSYDPTRELELGFCLGIDDGVVKKLMIADHYATSETWAVFICPPWSSGDVHYHVKSGIALPSKNDKISFLSSENSVMCIYAQELNCFTKHDNVITPIKVIIQ